MDFTSFPFSATDFDQVPVEIHNGTTGVAEWKIILRDNVRIRLVTFSAEYLSDHWCNKGHIIFCVDGQMVMELENGNRHPIKKGQMHTVGDKIDAHRTYSREGCTLFIVD